MTANKKNFFIFFSILVLSIIIVTLGYSFKEKLKKDETKSKKPITINLLTSVHPNLTWKFNSIEPKIIIKPGEVTSIEYMIENLGNIQSTGIATFTYFPKQFGKYITKIKCFCYDAKTLKSKEKDKFTLVMMIDPEASKDSKTKYVKEVTIQFNFFDYKEYKESKT